MRVLLIGKFPPGQGGIAAKFSWLYRALARRDIFFDVVTIVPAIYRSEETGDLPNTIRLRQLGPDDAPPWFLPGGDLWTERLVSAALALAEDEPPDLIEVNYLAPYGMAAFIVARHLGVPLIVRHAGSDLAKLLNWPQARRGLSALLAGADVVVTTPDAAPRLPDRTTAAGTLVELPRYVADPQVFTPSLAQPSRYRVLLVGKLNYHWRLKALDTLAAALELRPDWELMAIAGGKGRDAFEAEIRGRGLADRFHRRSFVPPDAVPALLSDATAVWAVERPGGIPDFSNIVWEALAMGRPCLVAASAAEHPDAALLSRSTALLVVDPDDSTAVAAALDKAASMPTASPPPGLSEAFEKYMDANASLYVNAAHACVVHYSGTREEER